jgi:hypothetical protein
MKGHIPTYEEFVNEAIKAEEAHRDKSAIQTVIDGKRDMGFITLKTAVDLSSNEFWNLVKTHNLGTIKLPQNQFEAYIFYNKSAEKKAKELAKIANKYGGFLSYEATKQESKRIGELLGYDKADIDWYLNKNYK